MLVTIFSQRAILACSGALHPCLHATVTWSSWVGGTRQYIPHIHNIYIVVTAPTVGAYFRKQTDILVIDTIHLHVEVLSNGAEDAAQLVPSSPEPSPLRVASTDTKAPSLIVRGKENKTPKAKGRLPMGMYL